MCKRSNVPESLHKKGFMFQIFASAKRLLIMAVFSYKVSNECPAFFADM